MTVVERVLGHHGSALYGGCDPEFLGDADRLLSLLRRVSDDARFTVVRHISHTFDPHGVTCVLVLAQSHMIGHSWPEHDVLAVDLFSCGPMDAVDVALRGVGREVRATWMTSRIDTRRFRRREGGAEA